jgi:hypothetical protein
MGRIRFNQGQRVMGSQFGFYDEQGLLHDVGCTSTIKQPTRQL